MIDIDDLQRRFEAERTKRANFDTTWQEIAERVLPAMADFNVQRAQGERRTEKLFDATAALAAQKAVSAISAFVWPANQKYQKLTTNEPSLNKAQRVKVYLDELTTILFDARYSPRAAFEAQMGQAALQHFVFGNGLLFVEDNVQQQAISYRAIHLAQAFLCEGASGRVDSVYRCWKWPLRLIAQKWGEDRLPEKLRARLATHGYEEHEVAHAVHPRTEYEPSKVGYPAMPWRSCYWLPGEKHPLAEGGFNTWPFAVLRFAPSPGEAYGRGPAWLALSNIKVLNAQKKSILQAAQKVVDPPLMAYDDGIMAVFNQTPGAMNFGALNAQGEQLVKPLITNADVRIGMDMMDKEREIIGSAFLMDVFRVLVENPQMTATQTLELLQERAIHMAPIAGRIESEGLGPMTERELDILGRAGQLPEMPPELLEAQGEYQIEYTSPMRKAMRSSDALAIARTIEQIAPLAQIDPTVMDVFDTHLAAREIAEIQGVPAKIIRDEETLKAMKEQRASDEQAAQLLQAAPVVSQTAANLAKLQAAGGLVPGTA